MRLTNGRTSARLHWPLSVKKPSLFFSYFPGVSLFSLDGGVGAIKAADVGNNAGNRMIDRMQVRRAKKMGMPQRRKREEDGRNGVDSEVEGKITKRDNLCDGKVTTPGPWMVHWAHLTDFH